MKIKEKYIVHFMPEEKEKADEIKKQKEAEGFKSYETYYPGSGVYRYEFMRRGKLTKIMKMEA